MRLRKKSKPCNGVDKDCTDEACCTIRKSMDALERSISEKRKLVQSVKEAHQCIPLKLLPKKG